MKEDFKGVPACGNLSCENARIVWRDGKRYVDSPSEGRYVPFDSFVQTALAQLVADVGFLMQRIDLIERYGLPLPKTVGIRKRPVEETWEDVDHSGLVP